MSHFLVRNHNDQFYGDRVKVEEGEGEGEEGIYGINGFEAGFFSEKYILDLIEREVLRCSG